MIPLCELEDETVWVAVGLSVETWRQLVDYAQRLSAATGEAELGAAELVMEIVERVGCRLAECGAEADAATCH